MRKLPNQVHVNHILLKIVLLMSRFNSIELFHVLRGLNTQEDLESNKGALQSKGTLTINGIDFQTLIP